MGSTRAARIAGSKDRAWVASKTPLPQAVADEHRAGAAKPLFLKSEIAAQRGRDSQHLEKAWRHPSSP